MHAHSLPPPPAYIAEHHREDSMIGVLTVSLSYPEEINGFRICVERLLSLGKKKKKVLVNKTNKQIVQVNFCLSWDHLFCLFENIFTLFNIK